MTDAETKMAERTHIHVGTMMAVAEVLQRMRASLVHDTGVGIRVNMTTAGLEFTVFGPMRETGRKEALWSIAWASLAEANDPVGVVRIGLENVIARWRRSFGED